MMQTERRRFLESVAGMVALAALPGGIARAEEQGFRFGPPQVFSWVSLIDQARHLAQEPYRASLQPAGDVLEQIDWAAHGKIQYRAERALFVDGPGPFPVEFFHPGKFFKFSVRMVRLDQALSVDHPATTAREISYDRDLFDMPKDSPAQKLGVGTGFAGFRIQESRLKGKPDWRYNDWAAFLGASYFRAIGDQYQYGISARGVAVNVIEGKGMEEFPAFTQFFFEPAAPDAAQMTLYALLDGPSLSGAYRFVLTRAEGVVMEVENHLFVRQDIKRFGIAPATSMYWFSDRDKHYQEDWRPEVHDSDGLALWTGTNEHLWRPLVNPGRISLSSFVDHNPRGFGLMQRQRQFNNYLDAVHYERRPGLWVEPLDGWGDGQVELVELHTEEEIYDNIVAMWVPQAPATAGTTHHFRYRLYWSANPPFKSPLAHCVSTRIGRGGESADRPAGVHKFVVEFQGDTLGQIPAGAVPEAVVSSSRGTFTRIATEVVPGGEPGHWRAIFDLGAVDGDPNPVDIRLFLRYGALTLTETWLYQLLTA